ncbi:MAG TPA: hypothetical protein VJA66_15330 [Thermoanaerobaculia bacterium]
MRHPISLYAVALSLAAGLQAQQPAPVQQSAVPPGQAQPASAHHFLDIYQVDLNPSGYGFALSEPVIQGDFYVFKVWPEGDMIRVPKARIKGVTKRTKDLDKEYIYQLVVVPDHKMYARDEPKLKGTNYLFHTWKEGTLVSLKQTDVQKVSRVDGVEAFKIKQAQMGVKTNANLPMQGGTATVIRESPAPSSPSAEGLSGGPNWIYYGVPGVTDAWAPPSATQAYPGDVPKLPDR